MKERVVGNETKAGVRGGESVRRCPLRLSGFSK